MTITYHPEVVQGSDEWHQMRCGMLTASEMKLILTPTLKLASNDKERAHIWELASQRVTQYVEPSYIGDNMLRGWDDEILARDLYSKTYAPVVETGFVTNDRLGFPIGYSPDGLVGDDGLIECKSRKQKFQVETIAAGTVPDEFMLQLQTGLIVTERKWVDFISYSGGLPMVVIRVEPIDEYQDAIIEAATKFEARIAERLSQYRAAVFADGARLVPTERKIQEEIYV
ncbi:MAG: lambda exonuclease family protein [Pseudomonadota bacterium]